MRIVDLVRFPDAGFVPVRITRLVAAKNQVSRAAWIERKQNAVRSAVVLDPQFLHVGMPGIPDCVHMRTAKGRTHFFEQVHRKVDAFVLILRQSSIPLGKFVADFDRPGHTQYIPLTVYIVKGIFSAGPAGSRPRRLECTNGTGFELGGAPGGAPFGVWFFKGACGEHSRTMRLLTLFLLVRPACQCAREILQTFPSWFST